MKRSLMLCVASAAIAFASPALADVYVMGGGMLTNLEDYNLDNVGYTSEVGLTNGAVAGGLEVSNHCHLGNCTMAAALNGRVFLTDWPVKPYGLLGVGATLEDNTILAQAGVGLMYKGFYGGYRMRTYFDTMSDFGKSRDGFAELGFMLKF